MAAWSGAAAARVEPAPRPRPRRNSRPSQASRRKPAESTGLLGGVLWIAALAALLGGVVALNVAVLRLNVRLDALATERSNLRASNAALSSQLSSATASPQLGLGLVQATPEQTTYVQLEPGGR